MWHAAMLAIDGVLCATHCKAKFLEAAIHASGVRAGKKVSGAFQNLIESKTRSDLSR